MRVDLLYALTNRTGGMNWHEVLQYTRKHAMMAEDLGFDSIWLGEHHFDTDGTDASPNPVMLAADLAARTSTLRLGMAAVTLTLWHPLKLAEDLALLDHFCDGRLDVAFGRGILPIEVMNINPEADRWRAPEASNEIFDENLEVIRKAWTQDPFSHRGKRHTFPHPSLKYRPAAGAPVREGYGDAEGNMTGFGLYPRPYQEPEPGGYFVTESLNGFKGAARQGFGAITWYPTGGVLQALFEAYQTEVETTTGVKPPLGENCGVLRLCTIAETDEEARRVSEEAVTDFFEFICTVRDMGIWLDADEGGHLHLGAYEHGKIDRNEPRFKDIVPFDFLMERNHLLIGSPETVADRMIAMTESNNIQHWLLQMGYPGIGNEDLERSLELFARKVMPAVREAAKSGSAA